MNAAYHTPCHLKALGAGEPLADLCDLIPGLEISRIEHGCSGMAGVFGLSKANLAESLAIGHDLIERMATDRFGVGMTECSACKMQMEQRTTRPTVHPLKLLALAYGLMPELHRALQPSNNRRLIS
jgi:Fe-S oxidoreductase